MYVYNIYVSSVAKETPQMPRGPHLDPESCMHCLLCLVFIFIGLIVKLSPREIEIQQIQQSESCQMASL